MFETDREVLDWYERQPRALSKEFIESIPWREISNYELSPAFVRVLFYMRDVEYFTDIYYKEARRTPTGKDPVIRQFMERWSVEESQHSEVLNRFLVEAGIPTSDKWQAEARAKIPWLYTIGNFFADHACKPFGKHFHGAHMVWGTINEVMTLQGYRRLSELAKHPVLETLLGGIMQEESIHASFYWNMARVKLSQAKFSRDLARFIINRYWTPVGQGAKPESETNYIVTTLFRGQEGLEFFSRTIEGRVALLPGFKGFSALTERMSPICVGAGNSAA